MSDPVLDRLRKHARVPLFRQGYALIASSAIAAVLGLVYWIVAARVYRPEVVGLNSAAISAMLFLSGLAQLNLSSALIRFVPTAGPKTLRLILTSYYVTMLVAALAATIFLAGLGHWTPNLDFLRSNSGFTIWFVASVVGWGIFVMQDAVLTGLRRAIWVSADATIYGIVKLVLLIAFAGVFPGYGIFASWTAAIVASMLPINYLILFKFVPARLRESRSEPGAVNVGQLTRFASLDYLGWLGFLAAMTLVPLMITQRAGGAENAYFSLSWTIIVPLLLISSNMGASLVVSAAADESRLPSYAYRTLVHTLRLTLPAAVGVAALAPYLLHLFGPDYARHATNCLRLLALASIPGVVNTTFVYSCRARRKLSLVVLVLGTECAFVFGLSYLLLDSWGITGVGAAWAIGQSVVATPLLIGTMPRLLAARRDRRPLPDVEGALSPDQIGGTAVPVTEGVPPRDLPSPGGRFDEAAGGLQLVRNAAADLRLLPLLKRRRSRVIQEDVSFDVSAFVAEVVRRGVNGATGADRWTGHETIPTLSDTVVIPVGPPGGPPEATIKVAHGPRGGESVRRERTAMAAIRSDPRLSEWRSVLPTVRGEGEISGRPYLVEGILPGLEAKRVLRRDAGNRTTLLAAARTIAELHRQTCSEPAPLDGRALARLIAEPLEALGEATAARPRHARRLRALEHLGQVLHRGLAGKNLARSWTHGDFVPANIFVTPDGTQVTGIVDWELAVPDGLPQLDAVHLLVGTRALLRRRELGQIVRELLREPRLNDEERAALETASSGIPGDELDLGLLVLVTWLQHTTGNLDKSDRYRHSWLWLSMNVDSVLRAFTSD